MTAILFFWFMLFLVVYSYAIYPVILKWWARGKILPYKSYLENDDLPTVAIFMSVLNEESVIDKKMQSVLNTLYPLDKLFIYIGSDGSTDNTNRLLDEWAAKFSNIRLFKNEDQEGKVSILNMLANHLSGKEDIILYTDANVFFTESLLFETIRFFKDNKIGQVASNVLNTMPSPEGIALHEQSYIRRENSIKYHEGLLWGSMQGAFGACYAVRASLLKPFPYIFVADDFYLSMHVLQKGFHAILNPKAICYEDVSTKADAEFNRKERISAGSFSNLAIYAHMLLNPFTAVGFTFISHKLIRWITPVFLILMPVCCLLVWNKFYFLLFLFQLVLMTTPLMDYIIQKMNGHIKLLRLVGYFYFMNLALLSGLIKYLRGVNAHSWTPTPRNV